jgi:hypothetical protein
MLLGIKQTCFEEQMGNPIAIKKHRKKIPYFDSL